VLVDVAAFATIAGTASGRDACLRLPIARAIFPALGPSATAPGSSVSCNTSFLADCSLAVKLKAGSWEWGKPPTAKYTPRKPTETDEAHQSKPIHETSEMQPPTVNPNWGTPPTWQVQTNKKKLENIHQGGAN